MDDIYKIIISEPFAYSMVGITGFVIVVTSVLMMRENNDQKADTVPPSPSPSPSFNEEPREENRGGKTHRNPQKRSSLLKERGKTTKNKNKIRK
jgi:hypothetical protein